MEDWFAEKHAQVEPPVLTAFGIEIHSRHAQANEIVQMINFARACGERKIAHYVNRAFYNSKAYSCTFELAPSVKEGDIVAGSIFDAAAQTIAQFDWFGIPEHGKRLEAQSYLPQRDE